MNVAGPSRIKDLKDLLQETKEQYDLLNPRLNQNDKRWPCPFCLTKSKNLIECTIHIKNDHPLTYKINKQEFDSQIQENE